MYADQIMRHNNFFKKTIIAALFIVSFIFVPYKNVSALYILPTTSVIPVQNSNSILSAFRAMKLIVFNQVSIPTIVEFPITIEEIRQQPFVLYEVRSNKPVHYLVKTMEGKPPVSISTGSASIDLSEIHDNTISTFVERPATQSINSSVFFYKSALPITSSSLKITLSPNAYEPETVSIYNYIGPGNSNVVVSQVPFNNVIYFPENTSGNWQIVITHKQPLRIAEMELVANNKIVQEYSVLRFLAIPNETYQMYLDSDRTVNLPFTEYVSLEDPVSNILRISEPQSRVNNQYRQADIDSDGIPDKSDNCPSTANADQVDVNKNSIGDACEDFDRDGVMNAQDNCPDNPNSNQSNADSDKYGDVCDPEESRLTERIWWLPWLGILVGFGTVGFILKSTVQAKKKVE